MDTKEILRKLDFKESADGTFQMSLQTVLILPNNFTAQPVTQDFCKQIVASLGEMTMAHMEELGNRCRQVEVVREALEQGQKFAN